MNTSDKMWAKCPQCEKKIRKDEINSPCFPFCSRRCKLADLYGWLENRYKITTPLNAERNEDDD